MAKINLYSNKHTSATSVSNIFIDEYMSEANGEFVKIYLYLLRQLNAPTNNFSLSEIADKFEHTEKDVKRALCYWERMQLLHLDYDNDENLIGIRLLDAHSKQTSPADSVGAVKIQQAASNDAVSVASDSVSQTSDTTALTTPQKKSYSADELKSFAEQEATSELLFIAEQYLGRTLTATDINTIFYFYDELKLPLELIEYLIEYCVSNKHSSIRYIEKVGIAWAESGFKTIEQAKLANGQYNQTYSAVMKALGINGRSLVSSETAFIDKWKNELAFSLDMIQKACEKTIQAIHEPSFEYTDRILCNWKSNNISTLDAVAQADSEHQKKKKASSSTPPRVASKNKFANFDQRTYNYDELERMLLTTSVK